MLSGKNMPLTVKYEYWCYRSNVCVCTVFIPCHNQSYPLSVRRYMYNAPVICNHCSPAYGEGREGGMTFSFQCTAMSPNPRGQTGCQNFALCHALRNRKFPLGKDPNVKTPLIPPAMRYTWKMIVLHF